MTANWRPFLWLFAVQMFCCAGRTRAPLPLPTTPLVPTQEQAFRAQPPPAQPQASWSPPVSRRATLPNGLTVFSLPALASSEDLIHVFFVNRRASEDDPRFQAGLASLTGQLLATGTVPHPGLSFRAELDSLGTSLTHGTDRDATVLSMSVRRADLDRALALLAEAVIQPSFAPDEFLIARRKQMDDRAQEVYSRNSLARGLAENLLYVGHPYSRPMTGLGPEIRSRTRESLVAYHHAVFAPSNCALVLAGPLDEPTVQSVASRAFGAWSQTPDAVVAEAIVSDPVALPAVRMHVIHRYRAQQSLVLAAWRGPGHQTANSPAVSVLETILGGMFTSRLNRALRHDAGYSYGASSDWAANHRGGLFVLQSNVRTAETAEAVTTIFRECERLRTALVTDAELLTAKTQLRERWIDATETPLGLAAIAAREFIDNRPANYRAVAFERLAAVTAEQVREAAQTLLVANSGVVVIVGDREQLQPQLRSAGFGPIADHDYQ